MTDFRLQWFDEDRQLWVQQHNWVSEKGYCYRQYDLSDGTSDKVRRISEADFISAYEELLDV